MSWRRARWLLLLAIAVLVGTTATASRGTTVSEQSPSGFEAPAMVVDGGLEQVTVAAKKQSRLVGLTLLAALALVVMHVGSHPRRAARSAWERAAILAVVRTAPSRGPPRFLLAPS